MCGFYSVPHVAGGAESEESEETLCRELFKELEPKYPGRILYCDDRLDHRQTKSLIGQCDLFIGARMHACVAAVSQCVPTVALAYSQKFKGVMDLVGSGVRVLDLRQEDTHSLCSGLREVIDLKSQWQADLKRKMPFITSEICGLFQSELLDVPSNRWT
jgi:polysaccharide pyruvyl transferase WcaK-like protein